MTENRLTTVSADAVDNFLAEIDQVLGVMPKISTEMDQQQLNEEQKALIVKYYLEVLLQV